VHQDHITLGDGRAFKRVAAFIDRDQVQARILLQVDRLARLADIGRRGPHPQAVQSVLDPILFDKRLGVRAEVGGQRFAIAVGQKKALGEQHTVCFVRDDKVEICRREKCLIPNPDTPEPKFSKSWIYFESL
jgi:hypothetical protein